MRIIEAEPIKIFMHGVMRDILPLDFDQTMLELQNNVSSKHWETAEGIYYTDTKDIYQVVYIENGCYRGKIVENRHTRIVEIKDFEICPITDDLFIMSHVRETVGFMNVINDTDMLSIDTAMEVFNILKPDHNGLISTTDINHGYVAKFGTPETYMVIIGKSDKPINPVRMGVRYDLDGLYTVTTSYVKAYPGITILVEPTEQSQTKNLYYVHLSKIYEYEHQTMDEFIKSQIMNPITHDSEYLISYAPINVNPHNDYVRTIMGIRYGDVSNIAGPYLNLDEFKSTSNIDDYKNFQHIRLGNNTGFNLDLVYNMITIAGDGTSYLLRFEPKTFYIIQKYIDRVVYEFEISPIGTIDKLVLKPMYPTSPTYIITRNIHDLYDIVEVQ